jgi:hypothetical protein
MNLEKEAKKSTDLQSEQVVNETETEPSEKGKGPSRTKIFMQDSLRKIGFGLLFILIGALVVGIALYLPAQTKLKTAQAEVDRLQPIESDYLVLAENYAIIQARTELYKTLSDTSMLNVALVNNESNRINQYIRYIEEDLKNLTVPNFPDLSSSLIDQFAEVVSIAASNRTKAIDKLGDFQNDLLLVADNLE